MTIEAKVIAHSRPYWAEDGSSDLYTLQLRYPRCIHSEFMTHRVFSRSASSSRAVPVAKAIDAIRRDPYVPEMGTNQAGMQSKGPLRLVEQEEAEHIWHQARLDAVGHADALRDLNIHKQWANRITEPYSHISVVVTATEWENFFKLRDHPDAQPEMQRLAKAMRAAMEASKPNVLQAGEWHLPYIRSEDRKRGGSKVLAQVSAARCARVSYLKHDGTEPEMGKDLELADKLLDSGHMSSFEHQAICWRHPAYGEVPGVTHTSVQGDYWSANFRNWGQHRQLIGACQRS